MTYFQKFRKTITINKENNNTKTEEIEPFGEVDGKVIVGSIFLKGHTETVSSVESDNNNIYTASYDGAVKVWNKEVCNFLGNIL